MVEERGVYHTYSVPAPRPTNQKAEGRGKRVEGGSIIRSGGTGEEVLSDDRKPGKDIPLQVYESNPGMVTF